MPSLPSGLPVELGSVRNLDTQLSRLLRLAVAGGPRWSLTRLLRRVVQIDGENSAGQTGLFLSALLGHSCAVRLLLAFGANPNHRCLDGSTPVHAGAFSGCSQVMLQLLQAGGDLHLHDQQGRTPRDWAEQGGARQSWEVVELLQLCRIHMSALLHGGELAPISALGPLYTSSGHSLCGSLSSLMQAERMLRPDQIGRSPQTPALGFGQMSSMQPLGLVTGIPLADPKELLPAQGEPDRTYESSSHTLMANLLWRGNAVTMRQLKAPGAHADVLLADLQHCSTLHHPNLLLLMALSPSADLSGLCLLFEPVWLGSLHVVLHQPRWREKSPRTVPGLLPGHMLLQVLEALLFLQARCRAHGGLSSHAVQLVRPGLAKVGNLEHGRPLNQPCLRPRLQQGYPWGGPGTGLPPPPELYPWLPLELIHGDLPAATSDLYSFCVLAQEVFTGELPWAGREGLEVKAKLEAGESPALDPLVPSPYQALVRAGLGLGPTDRWGSLQSTRYLLREAVAQDLDPEVSSPLKWTTLTPVPQGFPPEQMYYEVARRATTMPRPVHPGPIPSQTLETPEVTGHSGVQRGATWYSSSSLTLGSRRSHSPGSSHSPTTRVSLSCCPEPTSTSPAVYFSLQDSAFQLVMQSPVEQFGRKFSVKIPALQGLLQPQHGAVLLDPQPCEPIVPADPQGGFPHPEGLAGREGHKGRQNHGLQGHPMPHPALPDPLELHGHLAAAPAVLFCRQPALSQWEEISSPASKSENGGPGEGTQGPSPIHEVTLGLPLPPFPRMDLLGEIMAELQSGCQLGDKPSLGPTTGTDS